jgi:alpha-galactosidase
MYVCVRVCVHAHDCSVQDDCWSATTRNATGHLQPEAAQFPSGMQALADYVHSKGADQPRCYVGGITWVEQQGCVSTTI